MPACVAVSCLSHRTAGHALLVLMCALAEAASDVRRSV